MEKKNWMGVLVKYLHCHNLTHKPIHPDSVPLLVPSSNHISNVKETNHEEQEEVKVEKQRKIEKGSSRTKLSVEDEMMIKSLTAQMMIGCSSMKPVTTGGDNNNNNNNNNGNEMNKVDWIEKYEPSGVYIILKTNTDGALDLNKVQFSRRDREENRKASVYEIYNVVGRPDTSSDSGMKV
ncbi:uncharacterized protein LOC124944446 [Impatiens glandulifera]|uniref:uncharacterized protein LOC124944446 n=1 Tax=Impatiens glandulifera TaxID=253017 RepID=UPI001FB13354|nr:uncharacterized protein LOC124944446 [Impatiens glandulifera]